MRLHVTGSVLTGLVLLATYLAVSMGCSDASFTGTPVKAQATPAPVTPAQAAALPAKLPATPVPATPPPPSKPAPAPAPTPAPTPVPAAGLDQSSAVPLACTTQSEVAASGKTVTLTWSGAAESVTYTVEAADSNAPVDLGSVTGSATGASPQATYTAPAQVAQSFDVNVVATRADSTVAAATCKVRLIGDGAIGIVDDGQTAGLVGDVYKLTDPGSNKGQPIDIQASWFTTPPVATIVMPTVDVPNTAYQDGFPGNPTLITWFAIRLQGQLLVPADGDYTFQLAADDGANLYLDGGTTPVVNDDGCHPIQTATSAPVHLAAGPHQLRIDYFQGPPVYLALELKWQKPGDQGFSIIGNEYLTRPAGN